MKDEIRKYFPKSIPFPDELALLCDWFSRNGYPISGSFELRPDKGSVNSWFGSLKASERLVSFGAGADGSLYCIWDDGVGGYPIAHLGSQGDEIKILSENFRMFMVLLAIGYDELGFEDLSKPPQDMESINDDFKGWVGSVLNTRIPENGNEISLSENNASARFLLWVNSIPQN